MFDGRPARWECVDKLKNDKANGYGGPVNFFKICSAAGNRAAARLDGRIHTVKKECPDGRERAKVKHAVRLRRAPTALYLARPRVVLALAVLVLAGMAGFLSGAFTIR